MKINISIMTWINRILMIPFLILLLIGIVEKDYFSLAAILAFGIGVYQVFSSLMTLFYLRFIDMKYCRQILGYFSTVIIYFILLYVLAHFYKNSTNEGFISIVMCVVPVLLSLFWTYILESLKQEV
ncbi:hypothetical protein CXF68_00215 [Tenacibaculum sp. Bg11-29]|uniref:hypothetical protein n=1 Tax=Tenacibaculum sp. Bg11-29 TaxID=2058306 RepID=UPI000C3497FD|nr:hypothetical protein [Tenacibaculum sp. Bg11-29]PKH49204.1 hypothetical protein CXF68_00215 [Tenacibaculum sp. Bg11-29]